MRKSFNFVFIQLKNPNGNLTIMDNEVIENISYITTMVECELDESSRLIVKKNL
jgi:hypothetical protein